MQQVMAMPDIEKKWDSTEFLDHIIGKMER